MGPPRARAPRVSPRPRDFPTPAGWGRAPPPPRIRASTRKRPTGRAPPARLFARRPWPPHAPRPPPPPPIPAQPTSDDVYTELKQVYDPEIPVNIVDLGLIYDVAVDGDKCNIRMTLTSQSCPEAKTIPDVMKRRVKAMDGIEDCEIEIVWEPQWTPQLISEEGRKILQIDDV